MDTERIAVSILDRLQRAQELMEEVEILAAREDNVLQVCALQRARDICRVATVIDRLATSVRWGMIGRGDWVFIDGTKLGHGPHENLVRRREILLRRVSRLEARARDAGDAGREQIAQWYLQAAKKARAELAESAPTLASNCPPPDKERHP